MIEAVNHTGKMAYFTKKGGYMRFICDVKDFDPRENTGLFIRVMDKAIHEGAEITTHRKSLANSKYHNIETVMEINSQIHRAVGTSVQTSIVNCIRRYVEKRGYQTNKRII